jgi:arabinofuranan 3-O-arabinosyltransferase
VTANVSTARVRFRPEALRAHLEPLVLGGVFLVGAVVVLLYHPGRIFIDTRPDLYLDPGRLVRESLHTWAPGSGLGAANYDTGYLPTASFVWAIQKAGVPVWLSMRVLRLLLYVVAAGGARALLRSLAPSTGATGRVAVALAYVANPYVLVGAATSPVMLPYALLPWLLMALRRSLRGPWWQGPAAVGLVYFLMGGFNAGVVPLLMLLAVPLVVVDAAVRERVGWVHAVRGMLLCLLACGLVSAYWLIGSLSASGAASSVADATEDPSAIALVSSYAEVLRGLGGWLLYGTDALGPFRPGFTSYLTSPIVVVTSFTLPLMAFAGAALSRSRTRGLALALLVVGAVLMVGLYPPRSPSPFGEALQWGFRHVPLLIAFRTTAKVGALTMLGLALLVGLGTETLHTVSSVGRRWLVGLAGVGLVLSLTPVWFGDLFPGSLDVPSYWRTAARDLDERNATGRVWLLPGETNALYRWRPRGVDDFAPVLLDRRTLSRRSFPDGPAPAVNAMAAVDNAIESGTAPPGLVSTWARYLGAGDIVLRNDMMWELMGARRPSALVDLVEADPGLRPSALYGVAGTNLQPSRGHGLVPSESALAPVARYAVTDPASALRTMPTSGAVLVVGDNGGAVSAVSAGLLDGSQAFRLAYGMTAHDAAQVLSEGGRVLLTDSNRRRRSNDHRLNQSGPLLPAGVSGTGMRALGSVDDQTVAEFAGLKSLSATSSGSLFGPTPSGAPYLAVDGDPRTAWTFGDYGTARGQSLTLRLDSAREITSVSVRRVTQSLGARVSEVRVQVGNVSRSAAFGVGSTARVTFPDGTKGDTIRVTANQVSGRGANQVGIAEVSVPGLTVSRTARLPRTLDDLTSGKGGSTFASALAKVPLDISFTRDRMETERVLERTFTLPDARSYDVQATVALPAGARWRRCRPIGELDGTPVRARPTSRSGNTATMRSCEPVRLDPGTHDFVARATAGVDEVLLADTLAAAPAPAATDPVTWRSHGASYDVKVTSSADDRYLFLAEAYDDRWRAEIGGHWTRPLQLNGYGLGWRIPAGQSGEVHIRFGPQRSFDIALILSMLAALACAIGSAVPAVRRLARRWAR